MCRFGFVLGRRLVASYLVGKITDPPYLLREGAVELEEGWLLVASSENRRHRVNYKRLGAHSASSALCLGKFMIHAKRASISGLNFEKLLARLPDYGIHAWMFKLICNTIPHPSCKGSCWHCEGTHRPPRGYCDRRATTGRRCGRLE